MDHFDEPLAGIALAQALEADASQLTPESLDRVVAILREVDWIHVRSLTMWYRTPAGQSFRDSLVNTHPAVPTAQPSTTSEP